MSYTATIVFSVISSSPKSRSNQQAIQNGKAPLTTEEATKKAIRHIKYICKKKKNKTNDYISVIYLHQGNLHNITNKKSFLSEISTKLYEHTAAGPEIIRQEKRSSPFKKSMRVIEKILVTLPNDASLIQLQEICSKILTEFCGVSNVHGICSIHGRLNGDNNHANFVFINGKESIETAQKRASERAKSATKRTRAIRKYHISFQEPFSIISNRKKIAEIINEIANRDGLNPIEIRPLKDQDIQTTPQMHENCKRLNDQEPYITDASKHALRFNFTTMFKEKQGEIGSQPVNRDLYPKRWDNNPYIQELMDEYDQQYQDQFLKTSQQTQN